MSDLKVKWSKKENCLLYYFDKYSSDGSTLCDFFERITSKFTCDGKERALQNELIARGFDITTLKFSIKRKKAT